VPQCFLPNSAPTVRFDLKKFAFFYTSLTPEEPSGSIVSMQTRRIIFGIVGVGCLLAGVMFVATRPSPPSALMDGVSYLRLPGDHLLARFRLTNSGKEAISVVPIFGCKLAFETGEGWSTNLPSTNVSLNVSGPGVLKPGASAWGTAQLRRGIRRWQIACVVTLYEEPQQTIGMTPAAPRALITASPTATIMQPKNKFLRSLYRFIPFRGGNDRPPLSAEIWSPIFDAESWFKEHSDTPIHMDISLDMILSGTDRGALRTPISQNGRLRP
jgi:hypothetical protein